MRTAKSSTSHQFETQLPWDHSAFHLTSPPRGPTRFRMISWGASNRPSRPFSGMNLSFFGRESTHPTGPSNHLLRLLVGCRNEANLGDGGHRWFASELRSD